MKSLWLRVLCWYYDICPEHGRMRARNGWEELYCLQCSYRAGRKQTNKLDAKRDAYEDKRIDIEMRLGL